MIGYWIKLLPLAGFILLLSGCFDIDVISQPESVQSGKSITVNLEVKTRGENASPNHGIIAFKIPLDWEVKSIEMIGDYGRGSFEYLSPGAPDSDPEGSVVYWSSTLDRLFETEPDMHWVVYETSESYKAGEKVAFTDIIVQFATGEPGNFFIDYFVSTGALVISDPNLYGISRGHEINID